MNDAEFEKLFEDAFERMIKLMHEPGVKSVISIEKEPEITKVIIKSIRHHIYANGSNLFKPYNELKPEIKPLVKKNIESYLEENIKEKKRRDEIDEIDENSTKYEKSQFDEYFDEGIIESIKRRQNEYPPLMTRKEIAELLKAKIPTVKTWALYQSSFPKAEGCRGQAYTYKKKEIVKWATDFFEKKLQY